MNAETAKVRLLPIASRPFELAAYPGQVLKLVVPGTTLDDPDSMEERRQVQLWLNTMVAGLVSHIEKGISQPELLLLGYTLRASPCRLEVLQPAQSHPIRAMSHDETEEVISMDNQLERIARALEGILAVLQASASAAGISGATAPATDAAAPETARPQVQPGAPARRPRAPNPPGGAPSPGPAAARAREGGAVEGQPGARPARRPAAPPATAPASAPPGRPTGRVRPGIDPTSTLGKLAVKIQQLAKKQGESVAKELLSQFGVARAGEIPESEHQEALDLATAWLAETAGGGDAAPAGDSLV